MVENLKFGAFPCGEGSDGGRPRGFRTFCDEAVRFTHAYTPSVLSQPTIASILTAKFPFEHKVRHNGAQSLSAKEETFAELAFARGYRTSFFSGGPPIWRRSGLNQGFEVFEDNSSIHLNSFYRNASEVVRLFKGWLNGDSSRDRFASFLYFSDLQFADVETINEFGEARESSYQSQIDAIDEGLSLLISELKRKKIWDSTEVFLMGLQGDSANNRLGEISPLNLFSEKARTTLMIKPMRKQRDGPFNWKIDANVSLVDVGATLFEFIGVPRAKRESEAGSESLVHSLAAALLGPQPDWSLERPILTESAWAQWQGLGGIRAAIRRGPNLFIFDEKSVLFNTLTDSLELTPLLNSESRTKESRTQYAAYLQAIGFYAWKPLDIAIYEKASLSADLWRSKNPAPEIIRRLKTLSERYLDDRQLQGWRAKLALQQDDWNELRNIAKLKKPSHGFREIWDYVAARNLGETGTVPDHPCFGFLKSSQPSVENLMQRECRIEGTAELLAWVRESESETIRNKAMDSFVRQYQSKILAARIAERNQAGGGVWDTALVANGPDIIELILALPELKRQKTQLRQKFPN